MFCNDRMIGSHFIAQTSKFRSLTASMSRQHMHIGCNSLFQSAAILQLQLLGRVRPYSEQHYVVTKQLFQVPLRHINVKHRYCCLTLRAVISLANRCAAPRPFETSILDLETSKVKVPDSKLHGANMGPIWGRQDPGGPHVGPMNFAIWV